MATPKYQHILVSCLILVFISGFGCVEVSEFVRVLEYEEFSSTWPFFHTVPLLATDAVWTFQVEKNDKSCDNANVTIVLQHGSLPVINPLNEKYPDTFYVTKTNQATFHVISNNISVVSRLSNPLPGPWYGVAYLPKADGRLKPRDLFVECKYKMKTWFSSSVADDVTILHIESTYDVSLTNKELRTYRFFLLLPIHEYTVSVTNCRHGNQTDCPVTIATRGRSIPGPRNTTVLQVCSSKDVSCELTDTNPSADKWNFLRILSDVDDNLNFTITFKIKECKERKYGDNKVISQELSSASTCHLYRKLDRLSYTKKYKSKFVVVKNGAVQDSIVTIVENQLRTIPFKLEVEQDTGGSLVVSLDLKQIVSINKSAENVRVDFCLQKDSIPTLLSCNHGYAGNLNNTSGQGKGGVNVIIPYPQPGLWFVTMAIRCYKTNSEGVVSYVMCGDVSADVNVSVTTDACVSGGCSNHGSCINYLNGHVLYSTCRCDLGWRGFDCADGTEMRTETNQMLELLLLTISNVVFIPAIIMALYRRHYVEALVYTYTMVFSALYHACDGARTDTYKYCVMRPAILGTCDFLGSAVSIWVTLVAMSRPPLRFKAVLQMAGPLGILVGVLYRKTSAYLFLVPAGLGFMMIIISWICRCCYRHVCYPSKKKYLVCLLPGILLAAGGLFIFTFVEHSTNYLYTHSGWHACMALSILFLLPPRESRVYNVKNQTNNGPALNSTYQPIRSDENMVI